MSEHVPDFFAGDDAGKHFHQVIALHEPNELTWDAASNLIPLLPRGWWELSRLQTTDRIEFTHEFWLSQLPFNGKARVLRRLNDFFESVEEIGIFATQSTKKDPFDVHMVYSLKDEAGFFQGNPPALPETLDVLAKRFSHINFPADYLAFLGIHDGFSKYTDTGMIKSRDMGKIYQRLQLILGEDILVSPDGQVIDPEHLVPFYESFGLHCYQCFYANWYPDEEMGNVYFSEHDRSISNFLDRNELEENLAFPSFIGWLIFYLEDIWHI